MEFFFVKICLISMLTYSCVNLLLYDAIKTKGYDENNMFE